MKCYRQGDVLILEVKDLPDNLVPVAPDNKRNILAYGEVTGHAHALSIKESELRETESGDKYLTVPGEKAELKHEEHATILIPRGHYRIIQQVEYQKEFKQVID